MLNYKGFTGEVEINFETQMLCGKVTGFPPAYSACYSDMITFQGETVPQVAKAFTECVDDYLDFCKYLQSMEQTSNPIAAHETLLENKVDDEGIVDGRSLSFR